MCSIIDIEQLQTTTPGWQYGGCRLGNSCYLPEYNGNINNRADISDYVYTEQDAGPHAVTAITDATGTLLPEHNQNVSYTPFNKVSHISQQNYDYLVTYGPDRLRRQTSLHTGIADGVLLTKYYAFGDYEKEATPAATRHLHYISAGDGLAAVYVKNEKTISI